MKKVLLLIFFSCVFIPSFSNSIEKNGLKDKAYVSDFNFLDSNFTIKNYAVSARNMGSGSLYLKIAGISLLVIGIVAVAYSIPLVYFSAIGLGWVESDTYDVRFLNDNRSYGYSGYWGGVAGIIGGSIFIVTGSILTSLGFSSLGGRSAKLYYEGDLKKSTVGVSYKF